MLLVVATIPPTSTCAVFPKMMPLGLLMKTCPVALMRPSIWLAFMSMTRLSVTELGEGWLKLILALEPTLNVFHSIMPRWLV